MQPDDPTRPETIREVVDAREERPEHPRDRRIDLDSAESRALLAPAPTAFEKVFPDVAEEMRSAPEHPHAGRIAAVAHLSAALALADCAIEALAEDGIYSPEEAINDARHDLARAADEIMEPCEVANVLQTVEETIATMGLMPGPARAGVTGTWVSRDGRARIVQALIDVRAAGKDDETAAWRCDNCGDVFAGTDAPANCPSCDVGPHGSWSGADPSDIGCGVREPTDDEIYNRPGVEGGIAYPIDHANYREDT